VLPLVEFFWRHTSLLWHCWLGGRKGIRPVKKLSGGLLAWLSVWSEVQTCKWPNWCHCHSLSLASVTSRLVLPFWYRLTRVVPEKGPLNRCVCVCVHTSLLLVLDFTISVYLSPGAENLSYATVKRWKFIARCGKGCFLNGSTCPNGCLDSVIILTWGYACLL